MHKTSNWGINKKRFCMKCLSRLHKKNLDCRILVSILLPISPPLVLGSVVQWRARGGASAVVRGSVPGLRRAAPGHLAAAAPRQPALRPHSCSGAAHRHARPPAVVSVQISGRSLVSCSPTVGGATRDTPAPSRTTLQHDSHHFWAQQQQS